MKRIVASVAGVLVFSMLAAGASAAPRGTRETAQPRTIQLAAHLLPAQGQQRVSRHQLASTNWSGYVARQNTFSDVTGSWTEPPTTPDPCANVKGKQVTVASFWAGLDGWDSRTVEQTGTDEECIGTTRVDVAWIEFYPARPIVVSTNVHPGDSLTAHVYQDGNDVYANLVDSKRGLDVTQHIPVGSLAFNSAEWIGEAPTNRLTAFGSVDFSSGTATAGTSTDPIANWSPESITMYSKSGGPFHSTIRACPGPLSTDSFTDYYGNCH